MIRDFIHRRTREEWNQFFKERLTLVRIFVQENGEVSALASFGIGAVIVFFYKISALFLCLAVLAYLLIILNAKEG